MSDPKGTLRTHWAASVNDGERLYHADTREEAIGAAIIAREEEAECDGYDLTWPVDVLVYRDVLWCNGTDINDNGCYCGSGHDDYKWMAMDWAEKEWTESGPPVWVTREDVPDAR